MKRRDTKYAPLIDFAAQKEKAGPKPCPDNRFCF
jgi:hypothetical protein